MAAEKSSLPRPPKDLSIPSSSMVAAAKQFKRMCLKSRTVSSPDGLTKEVSLDSFASASNAARATSFSQPAPPPVQSTSSAGAEADDENERDATFVDFVQRWYANVDWADQSLLLFRPDDPIRKLCISLVHSDEFVWAVQLLILTNCICMLLADPLIQNNPAELDANELQQRLITMELVFNILFSVEALIGVVALGFLLPDPNAGQKVAVYFRGGCLARRYRGERRRLRKLVTLQDAYLLQTWNRVDAVVLVVSWLALAADSGGLSILRLLRLLKPLRTLKTMPGVRRLVNAHLALPSHTFHAPFSHLPPPSLRCGCSSTRCSRSSSTTSPSSPSSFLSWSARSSR